MSATIDDIINFDQLQSNLISQRLKLDDWIVVRSDQNIYIFNLTKQISGNLTIRNTISINCVSSVVNVFVNNYVMKSTVTSNVKINRWFQLQNLIDNLKNNVEHSSDILCELDNVIVAGNVIKVEPDRHHEDIRSSELCTATHGELFDWQGIQPKPLHKTTQEELNLHPHIESVFLNEIKIEPTKNCTTNQQMDGLLSDTSNICSECGKKFDQYMELHHPCHFQVCPIRNEGLPVSKHQPPIIEHNKSTPIIKVHSKLTKFDKEFYCDICDDGRDYKTKTNIRLHMKNHWKLEMTSHIDPLSKKCPTCGKEFSHYRKLSLHMKRHNPNLWRSCPICKKSFPDGLRRHMNTHLKIKNFVCHICGLAYSRSSSLIAHTEANHLEGIGFFCDICKNGRNYRSRDYLKRHFKKSHSSINKRNIQCLQCNLKFGSKWLLNKHILSAHPDAKQICQCEICHKMLADKSMLKIHKMLHSDVKEYSCEECGKLFSQASYLRKHIKRHKGWENKRKFCSMCDRRYVSNHDLRLHLKKVHGVELKNEKTSYEESK